MTSSIRLGRIFGIELGIHYTWFIIFGLLTWSLSASYFPAQAPGGSPAAYWLLGAVAALLFFSSVVLHELGHSLVALRRGIPVRSITLFIFGGAANIEREVERPADEVAVTAAGPAVSLALAGICWLLAQAAAAAAAGAAAPGAGTAVANALFRWLSTINLYMALFNLLPGFPLDGGRLLRAALWAVWGDFVRATRAATRSGQLVSYLLMGFGFVQILGGNLGGWWLIFLGWFMSNAAESSYQAALTQTQLRSVPVERVMRAPAVAIDPAATIGQLVEDYILGRNCRAVLVQRGGQLLGIITLTDVKRVPREHWPTEPVAAWMTPTPLQTVQARDAVGHLLEQMASRELNSVPVLSGNQIVGMVTRTDVIRYLQMRRELGF